MIRTNSINSMNSFILSWYQRKRIIALAKQTADFYQPPLSLCERRSLSSRRNSLLRSSFALTSSSHCLVHPPSPPLTLLIFHKERFKASWMSVSPPKIRRTPREGSVPRIIGFKFSEEPQTNWLFVVHPRSKRFSSRHHRRHVLVSSSWYIAEEEEDEGFFFT